MPDRQDPPKAVGENAPAGPAKFRPIWLELSRYCVSAARVFSGVVYLWSHGAPARGILAKP